MPIGTLTKMHPHPIPLPEYRERGQESVDLRTCREKLRVRVHVLEAFRLGRKERVGLAVGAEHAGDAPVRDSVAGHGREVADRVSERTDGSTEELGKRLDED